MEDSDSARPTREDYEVAIAIIKELKPAYLAIRNNAFIELPGLEEIIQIGPRIKHERRIMLNYEGKLTKKVIKQTMGVVQKGSITMDVNSTIIDVYLQESKYSGYALPIVLDILNRVIYSPDAFRFKHNNFKRIEEVSAKYHWMLKKS